jgi:hypothetical protein
MGALLSRLSDLLMGLVLCSLVGIFVGVCALLSSATRAWGKRTAIWSAVLLFVFAGLFGWATDREAEEAGFESSADKTQAAQSGYTDANKWKVDKSFVLEKLRLEKEAAIEKTRKEEKEAQAQELLKKEQEQKECEQSLSCISDKKSTEATAACVPLIERSAKYDFEWTDGFIEPKISHSKWANKKDGTITFIGDMIKFENGFGAKTRMIYECDYNFRKKAIIDVRVHQGRLPEQSN